MNNNLEKAPKLIDSCGKFLEKREKRKRVVAAGAAGKGGSYAKKLLLETLKSKLIVRNGKMEVIIRHLLSK